MKRILLIGAALTFVSSTLAQQQLRPMMGETAAQFEARKRATEGTNKPADDAEALVKLAAKGVQSCQTWREIAILRWRRQSLEARGPVETDESEYERCVAEQSRDLEPVVNRLRAKFASNPRVMDALRDFYATWKAALADKDISSKEKNSAAVAAVRQKATAVETAAEW